MFVKLIELGKMKEWIMCYQFRFQIINIFPIGFQCLNLICPSLSDPLSGAVFVSNSFNLYIDLMNTWRCYLLLLFLSICKFNRTLEIKMQKNVDDMGHCLMRKQLFWGGIEYKHLTKALVEKHRAIKQQGLSERETVKFL